MSTFDDAVRAALAVLNESTNPPVDDVAAAAALNAQTQTLTNQPFPWIAAKNITLASDNFSWAKILLRSKGTAAIPPVSADDYAVLVAITAVETAEDQIIDPTNVAAWTQFYQGLAVLESVGDLIADDVVQINALTSKIVPLWPVAISPDYITSIK